MEDRKTTVVNLSVDEYEVYIGRGRKVKSNMLTPGLKPGEEGWLGNPHPIGFCEICRGEHSRDECIAAFKNDFYTKLENDLEFRDSVKALHGSVLGCYCKPDACHGDIITEWINKQD